MIKKEVPVWEKSNLTPIETDCMNLYEDLRKTKLQESAICKVFEEL